MLAVQDWFVPKHERPMHQKFRESYPEHQGGYQVSEAWNLWHPSDFGIRSLPITCLALVFRCNKEGSLSLLYYDIQIEISSVIIHSLSQIMENVKTDPLENVGDWSPGVVALYPVVPCIGFRLGT